MEPGRQRLIAVVVILVLSVPLVVIAASSGGSDDREQGRNALRVELAPDLPPRGQVIVYLKDAADNKLEQAGGRRSVGLECLNRAGDVVLRGRHRWPFVDTDGGVFEPHVHQNLRGGERGIVRCRLVGTKGPLEGAASAAGL